MFRLGNCDGSAAVMIDAQTLLIANDENNILHGFDLAGGDAVARATLKGKLDLPEKFRREIDIEAVARDGDLLWWIGSHGINSSGKTRENRQTLFATNIPRRDLSDLEVTRPRADLLDLFKNAEALAPHIHPDTWTAPPKEGGFNIEGLAKAGEGRLLVGLRSPLTAGKGMTGEAILVTLAQDGTAWSVADVTTLPLKDRGVRDIVPTLGGYLLIAGGVASTPDQSLYFWNGADDPVELPIAGLDDLNAEALVQAGSDWLVLGDEGSVEREDASGAIRACKDIAEDSAEAGTDDPAVAFRGWLFQSSR